MGKFKKTARFNPKKIGRIPEFDFRPYEDEIKILTGLCDKLKIPKTAKLLEKQAPGSIQAIQNYIILRLSGIIENELNTCIPRIIDKFQIPAKRAMSEISEYTKDSLEIRIDDLDQVNADDVTKGKIVLLQFKMPNVGSTNQFFSGVNDVKDFFMWQGELYGKPPVKIKNPRTGRNEKKGAFYRPILRFGLDRNDITHYLTNTHYNQFEELKKVTGFMQGFVKIAYTVTCINIAIEQKIKDENVKQQIKKWKLPFTLPEFKKITTKHREAKYKKRAKYKK